MTTSEQTRSDASETTAYLPREDQFLGPEADRGKPHQAGAVIVPVPFERTSSYGRGSRGGPAAIIHASHEVELRDAELGCEPWMTIDGIATLRPLAFDETDEGQAVADRLERTVGGLLDRHRTVLTLAGEHTGVVGAIRAYARRYDDLTVLQLDAHSDLRRTYLDDPWNHACAMARVLDFHRDIVQVGIRSESTEDLELLHEHGLHVTYGESIQRQAASGGDWIEPIVEACSANVYITFDCDVLDPSVMPATGTPEPGGLTWIQVDDLLARLCRSRRVVGFDVSELAPVPGLHHCEFTAAKLVYRLIGRISEPHDT